MNDDRRGYFVLQSVDDFAELGEMFDKRILLLKLVAGHEDFWGSSIHWSNTRPYSKTRALNFC